MKAILRKSEGGGASFWCPGCDEAHNVNNTWEIDFDTNTISPSVLVRSGHYANPGAKECWCTYNEKHPDKKATFICSQCHSFVRNGMIEFLSDCSHKLANQTVALESF